MKRNVCLIMFFVLATLILGAQEKKSRADVYYFEFAYKEAIKEYQKEGQRSPLTDQQQLNLADAYLKTNAYQQASETYLEVYKKDSTMSVHHFNNMLQAMSRTSGIDRVRAFLATKKNYLSRELLENAEFNFELLGREEKASAPVSLFNLRANSPQSDFGPSFYKDRMLFTSGRGLDSKQIYNPSGEAFLDIYVARLNAEGDITNAAPFTGIPENSFHEATPFFSEALDKVFYIRSNEEDGILTFDEKGRNSLAMGLADADGNFNYLLRDLSTSFYYPFYDATTGKLYFAANLDDSYGGTDLYFVYTNEGRIMSAPVNLGPRINTPGNEIAPYVFDSSFYFSSDIFYGLGGMDIYKSEMQPDQSFSIPVNLGKEINSTEDDFGLIIKNNPGGGLIGYYASNRPGGKGKDDIYGFEVAEKPGLKTLVFRGTALNKESGEGVGKAAVRLKAMDGTQIKEVYTDDNGRYRMEIPLRDSVALEVSRTRFSVFKEVFGPKRLDSLRGNIHNIELTLLDDLVRETEGQTVIKMDKFYFDKNSATVTPEIAAELDKAVRAVQLFPELQLRIEAYTDSRGSNASNLKISQSRADAIKKYLLSQGVAPSNILFTVGYGEEKIINNCTNGVYCLDILHKQNERHLIAVLNYGQLFE